MRGPGGQSVRLQWQQHHKLSGIERAGTGAEGFRYDRHGNLLAYGRQRCCLDMEYGRSICRWRERTVKATAGSTATIKTRCN
ncbi:hypothetical protein H6S10_26560 (plasmid) [Escherichia coli]|nr:hypothetical protein H6S10_26560 [Escherichia coli]